MKRATKKAAKKKVLGAWTSADIMATCPLCQVRAVVLLPPALLAMQPDDTTHVCNPGFGGCNHGFALDEGWDQAGYLTTAVH